MGENAAGVLNLDNQKSDIGKYLDNKDNIVDLVENDENYDETKRELDNIQNDLNELLESLNNFISDNKDISECQADGFDSEESDEDDMNLHKCDLLKDYIIDGENPSINWDNLAPFVQNIVGDLKKLRNLNNKTNNVVRRIREITTGNIFNLECMESNELIINDDNP